MSDTTTREVASLNVRAWAVRHIGAKPVHASTSINVGPRYPMPRHAPLPVDRIGNLTNCVHGHAAFSCAACTERVHTTLQYFRLDGTTRTV